MSKNVTAAQRRFAGMAIPEGWEVIRLGQVFEQVIDTGHTQDLPVLSVTMHDGVVRRDSLDRRFDREVDRKTYRRVLPGDIAYNTMRMWQGASGLVHEEGYVSPAYTVVRPAETEDPQFWAHYFKHPRTIRRFLDHSQGFAKDRYRLYFKHFATVPALRPPLEEQRKIAVVLSSIDLALQATEALAVRLRAIRQGLIEQQLAEARKTCRVVTLSDVARVQTGVAKNKAVAGTVDLPYLSVANVQDGFFDLGDVKRITLPADRVERYLLQEGDVLLTEGGDYDKLGRGAVWRGEIAPCAHQNHVFAVRVDSSALLPDYLALLTGSGYGRAYFQGCAKQTTNLASINKTQLRAFPCPLLSIREQERIVEQAEAVTRIEGVNRKRSAALGRLKLGLMQDLLSGRRKAPKQAKEPGRFAAGAGSASSRQTGEVGCASGVAKA